MLQVRFENLSISSTYTSPTVGRRQKTPTQKLRFQSFAFQIFPSPKQH